MLLEHGSNDFPSNVLRCVVRQRTCLMSWPSSLLSRVRRCLCVFACVCVQKKPAKQAKPREQQRERGRENDCIGKWIEEGRRNVWLANKLCCAIFYGQVCHVWCTYVRKCAYVCVFNLTATIMFSISCFTHTRTLTHSHWFRSGLFWLEWAPFAASLLRMYVCMYVHKPKKHTNT